MKTNEKNNLSKRELECNVIKKYLSITKRELIETYEAVTLANDVTDIRTTYINSPEFQKMHKNDQARILRLFLFLEDWFWNKEHFAAIKNQREMMAL